MSIPGSNFSPGVRQRIQLLLGPSEPGANQKILLVGYRSAAIAADFDLVPQRVLSEGDAVQLAGEGSQLALMARSAFAVGPLARLDQVRGFLPEVWIMAVAPPIAPSVAAQYTMTVAGTATANAQMPVELGNERGFISVVTGDTADDVAAKLNAFIQGRQRFTPYTSGVASNVVTLDARDIGVYSNELFLWADDRRVPGITVTVARAVDGTGVVDLTAAFTATTGDDWAVVVLPQEDDTTRDAIKPHLDAMWDENTQLRRRVIMPHGGLLTDAATDAQAIDDWRGIVASLERRAGAGIPWDPAQSARSFSWEGAAALGARLESQRRANWNFNRGTLPTRGRPRNTLTGVEYDAAHQAGVSIITDGLADSPGVIDDPITTATTDQTGITTATDRTFLPAEIARVVRFIAALHAVTDARFAQAEAVSDEATRLDIKAAGQTVLDQASDSGWIQPVSDADITVEYTVEGGQSVANRQEQYTVLVGLDKIRVIHLVGRA
jgi:hypothetical protein